MNFLTALAAIGGDSLLSTIILIVIIVVVLIVIFSFVPIGLWISALAAGAKWGFLISLVCVCAVWHRPRLSTH